MVFTPASSTPMWVLAISILNVLFLCALFVLAIYAMWKVFRWLRKWRP